MQIFNISIIASSSHTKQRGSIISVRCYFLYNNKPLIGNHSLIRVQVPAGLKQHYCAMLRSHEVVREIELSGN